MRELINMIENHQMAVNHHSPDVVMWRMNETEYCRQFFTAETWQRIRVHGGLKEWSKVVWFQLGVPRFAFITWLAIRNRLSTGKRTGAGVNRKDVSFVESQMRHEITCTLRAPTHTLYGLKLLVLC